jgi:hypothetical protein
MKRCERSPSFDPRSEASISIAAIGPSPFLRRRALRFQLPGMPFQPFLVTLC